MTDFQDYQEKIEKEKKLYEEIRSNLSITFEDFTDAERALGKFRYRNGEMSVAEAEMWQRMMLEEEIRLYPLEDADVIDHQSFRRGYKRGYRQGFQAARNNIYLRDEKKSDKFEKFQPE